MLNKKQTGYILTILSVVFAVLAIYYTYNSEELLKGNWKVNFPYINPNITAAILGIFFAVLMGIGQILISKYDNEQQSNTPPPVSDKNQTVNVGTMKEGSKIVMGDNKESNVTVNNHGTVGTQFNGNTFNGDVNL
jgi:uncharacterized integral membrane protein